MIGFALCRSDCLNQESRTVLPHGLVFSPNGASSTLPEVPVTGNHTGTIPATVRTFGTDLSGEGRRRKEKGVASSSRGVLRLVDDTEYETESGPMEDEVGQKRSSASVVVAREEAKKMANDVCYARTHSYHVLIVMEELSYHNQLNCLNV